MYTNNEVKENFYWLIESNDVNTNQRAFRVQTLGRWCSPRVFHDTFPAITDGSYDLPPNCEPHSSEYPISSPRVGNAAAAPTSL